MRKVKKSALKLHYRDEKTRDKKEREKMNV